MQVVDLPHILGRVTHNIANSMRHFTPSILLIVNGRQLESENHLPESAALNPLMAVFEPMEPPQALDHIQFEQDGTVRVGQNGKPLEFSFGYLGLRFGANTRNIDTGTILQVAADIAPDPYSVEGADLRRAVHAIIEESQHLNYSRLVITKQKRIFCIGKASVNTPAAPVDLISAAVEIMLDVKPYLDMLAEILPSWPSGSGNPTAIAASDVPSQ
jgi:hypothetical protein